MLYTLDTNFVARVLDGNRTASGKLKDTLKDGHVVMFNVISYYEVKRGLHLPTFRRKLATFEMLVHKHGVLELDTRALNEAVDIYQMLRLRGELIEDADLLIGAIAKANNATLVTHNTRHFGRIAGLTLEDWE